MKASRVTQSALEFQSCSTAEKMTVILLPTLPESWAGFCYGS